MSASTRPEVQWEVVKQFNSGQGTSLRFDLLTSDGHLRFTIDHGGFPIGVIIEKAVREP